MMDLKKVTLNEIHEQLGAKMVDFAGFYMPVRYSSDKAEHLAVREGVGVFDVSHMGEFMLRGEKALDLIQYVSSNDAAKLTDGKVQYSCLPNEEGGIVDDLLIYRMSATEYMLVVNASNIEKDWNWISSHNTFGVEMENISDQISLLAVQGPKATEALQPLTAAKLADIPYYSFVKGTFAGVPDVIISSTGYTGAGGFELYIPNEQAEKVWHHIFEVGKPYNIQPIGLGARDTLRLEMGYCLYGNDIDDVTSPLEAGLSWITKFNKDFINAENLKKQKETGIAKKLVGFVLEEGGVPRRGYDIEDASGQKIGQVTSGTMSPSMNKGIGMGYVNKPYAKVDTEIFINIRGKQKKATIVKLPIYKKIEE